MPKRTWDDGTPICVICGAALSDDRRALVCSAPCAAEQSVLRAIIAGSEKRRYGCAHDFMRRHLRSRMVIDPGE